jgi:hypothetical protein
MNKAISAIAILLVLGLMAFTNPNREKYIQYASERIIKELPQDFCKTSKLEKWLDFSNQDLTKLCQSGLGIGLNLGQGAVRQIIDDNTQRQNFILLSIYTTQLSEKQYQTAGLFGKFITFKKT